jgi:hypothetical protein
MVIVETMNNFHRNNYGNRNKTERDFLRQKLSYTYSDFPEGSNIKLIAAMRAAHLRHGIYPMEMMVLPLMPSLASRMEALTTEVDPDAPIDGEVAL